MIVRWFCTKIVNRLPIKDWRDFIYTRLCGKILFSLSLIIQLNRLWPQFSEMVDRWLKIQHGHLEQLPCSGWSKLKKYLLEETPMWIELWLQELLSCCESFTNEIFGMAAKTWFILILNTIPTMKISCFYFLFRKHFMKFNQTYQIC